MYRVHAAQSTADLQLLWHVRPQCLGLASKLCVRRQWQESIAQSLALGIQFGAPGDCSAIEGFEPSNM